MTRPRIRAALVVVALGASALVASSGAASGQAAACPAPSAAMEFAPPAYVDMNRAGGEPMIHTHPDGTLLYGSHAGTTHFFTPAAPDADTAAFIENYRGQTYSYWSDDNGETWNFVERATDPANAPASGFSDPDYAIDTDGNVYLSEINLANVAVSRSGDVGRSFELANFFGLTVSDRQWKEADEPGVVYMVANAFAGGSTARPVGDVGHNLYKSTNGGATFSAGRPDGDGLGDIRVDQSDGTLYQTYYDGFATDPGTLSMASYRGARADDLTPDINVIAEGVAMLAHWPVFHLDPSGNLYVTWDESGAGDREAGVYYSSSTDRGRTWIPPVRLDSGPETDIWPWLAVGDDGRVAVAWLGNDEAIPDHDAEAATAPWNLYVSQSLNGVGCATSDVPGFSAPINVTPGAPPHVGTICQGGTTCQAQAIDRRLGDYFSTEVDGAGNFVIAYSDTRSGGGVSLPGFLRQTGGPSLFGAPEVPAPEPIPTIPGPPPEVEVTRVQGVDRVATAAAVSAATRDAATTVVIARSDEYADALTGAPLAVDLDAPLLLSAPDRLSMATAEEAARLGATEAVLLGGTVALSDQVAQDLRAMGITPRRVAGPTRFATAVAVRDALPPSEEIILAEGRDADRTRGWPDALSASGFAAGLGLPVLLTDTDTLPAETAGELAPGIDVTIVGGTAAVSEVVAQEVDRRAGTVDRVAGANRYATSAAVADLAVERGLTPATTWVATGLDFADGLVAGAAAGADRGVLVLVDGKGLDASPATRTWIADHAADVDRLLVAGGTRAVTDDVLAELRGLVAG